MIFRLENFYLNYLISGRKFNFRKKTTLRKTSPYQFFGKRKDELKCIKYAQNCAVIIKK